MMSRLLTRREQVVLGSLAAALLTGSITIFALRGTSPEPEEIVVEPIAPLVPAPSQPLPETSESSAAPVPEVIVSLQGAVMKPGVYRVDADSRVNDLILKAGGLLPSADTRTINLAARVVDGTTLTVPERRSTEESTEVAPVVNPQVYGLTGASVGSATMSAISGSGSSLVDLNTATQQELETLPGIGPKLAQRIIQYRTAQPFRDVTDLMNVSGIGESKLASVRDLVTVR